MSKKLKSMETQLDLQLFVRGSNQLQLTPAGYFLYEKWQDSVKKLMEAFSKRHPDISLRIESDAAQDIREMLIHGETDLVFSIYYDFAEKEMDQIEWCLLGRTSHCACMRKDHPLAGRASISMTELRRSDFVAISPQYLPEYTDMLKGLCLPFGFAPNITNYVSSANSLTLNLHTDRDVFICDKYYADLNRGEHALVIVFLVMFSISLGGSANFTTSLPAAVFGRHGFKKVNSVLFPIQALVSSLGFMVNGNVLNATGSLRMSYVIAAAAGSAKTAADLVNGGWRISGRIVLTAVNRIQKREQRPE